MKVDGTYIGECIYPLNFDVTDYSRFERDTFGNITVIQRGYSDTITFTVYCDNLEQAMLTKSILTSKRAVKATYSGNEDIPITQIEGYLRSLKIEIIDREKAQFTFTVETEVTT